MEAILEDHLELPRRYDSFVRPHRALKFECEVRTPAMQAGLVSKQLSSRQIFVAESGRILFVVVLSDSSGSIENRLNELQIAAITALRRLKPEDPVALYSFTHKYGIALRDVPLVHLIK
jgi:hypothetical protein